MKTPSYDVVRDIKNRPLIVKDLGPWDRFPTITNAAEELVDDLMAKHLLEPGRRLFYYDSENQLDELVLEWNPAGDRVRFKGFAMGPEVMP